MLKKCNTGRKWRTNLKNIHEEKLPKEQRSKARFWRTSTFQTRKWLIYYERWWKYYDNDVMQCCWNSPSIFFLMKFNPRKQEKETNYHFRYLFCLENEKGVVNEISARQSTAVSSSIRSRLLKWHLPLRSREQFEWSIQNPTCLSIKWPALTYPIKNGKRTVSVAITTAVGQFCWRLHAQRYKGLTRAWLTES